MTAYKQIEIISRSEPPKVFTWSHPCLGVTFSYMTLHVAAKTAGYSWFPTAASADECLAS